MSVFAAQIVHNDSRGLSNMTVTMQIALPDDLIPILEQRARSAGLKREEYISVLLSRDLRAPQTLDEILAEFREQVQASGMSDAELEQLFASARDEVHEQKVR